MAHQLNFAELRFDAGQSPEELAAEIGISGRTLRRIEEGRRPSPAVAKKVADHFHRKASEIWPVEEATATR